MTKWEPGYRNDCLLVADGRVLAYVCKAERGWKWSVDATGKSGRADTAEQARREAEREAMPPNRAEVERWKR